MQAPNRFQNIGRIFSPATVPTIQHLPGGTLVYVPGSCSQKTGRSSGSIATAIPQPLAAPPRAFRDPRLSPDGRVVALTIGGTPPILALRHPRHPASAVHVRGRRIAVWSTDGGRFVFAANRGGSRGHVLEGADGGAARNGWPGHPTDVPATWTGRTAALLFIEADADGPNRDAPPDRSARPVLASAANESAPALSPDAGHCVCVGPSAPPRSKWRLSSVPKRDPGLPCGWIGAGLAARRHRTLFRSGTRMMAAAVRTQPSLSVQPARSSVHRQFEVGTTWRALTT